MVTLKGVDFHNIRNTATFIPEISYFRPFIIKVNLYLIRKITDTMGRKPSTAFPENTGDSQVANAEGIILIKGYVFNVLILN